MVKTTAGVKVTQFSVPEKCIAEWRLLPYISINVRASNMTIVSYSVT